MSGEFAETVASDPRWATRCPACDTSFRVTPAQLEISDGYVRCGRCDHVFDARESLFDLDGAPVSAAPPPSPPDSEADSSSALSSDLASDPTPYEPAPTAAPEPADTPEPASVEATWVPPPPSNAMPAAARQEPRWEEPGSPGRDGFALTELDESALSDTKAMERLRTILGVEDGPLSQPAEGSSAELGATPPAAAWNSLRERHIAPVARWQRGTLLVLCAILTLALPLQWAWIERDALRARYPQVDQLLKQHLPGLPTHPWRRLDGLTVASSHLQATPQGDAYQLDLVLSNRHAASVAQPWLDLELSDTQGRPLLRRSLSPDALLSPSALAAGEQRRLQAVFRVEGNSAVGGYVIHLFHP